VYSDSSAAAQALIAGRTHRLATCWKIERTDGTTLRFTDHDAALEFGGETYTPAGGVSASARRRSAGLGAQNLEVLGALDSAAITHDDLRAGRYRDAKVTESLVDWRYPWAGAVATNVYWIARVEYTGEQWEASVESIARRLQSKVGGAYTRSCRHRLGSAACGVTLSSYTDSGVVSAVSGGGLDDRRVFQATGPAGAAGYYDLGYVEWLTGSNAGLTHQVKTHTVSPITLALQLRSPFAIQVGDTFDIVAGCDKLAATCKTKFSNMANFGGFPFVPGNDRMMQTPET
jgi:uncharacterized phage protein (TIGR02218 family)